MITTRFSDGKTRLYVVVKKALLADATSDEARARLVDCNRKNATLRLYLQLIVRFGETNDEYFRWMHLRLYGCSDCEPFDESVYGMLVIWEITATDAERLSLPDTESVALAGEWALEKLRSYCSFYRAGRIAGGTGKRDRVYERFALEHAEFRREVRLRLLVALELSFYVPSVSHNRHFVPTYACALSR